jgi:hypothetical protein
MTRGVQGRRRVSTVRVLVLLSGLLCASPALAQGWIEINQARALAGGITPGDGAGFPITISQPGSYRLTGNLDRSGAALATRAIEITANDVTLDLGGFALSGATVCTPIPVTSCTNVNPTGHGIWAQGFHNLTIRDGTVRGMPGWGIRIDGTTQVTIERIRAISNGVTGIQTDFGRIVDSEGSQNGDEGINSAGSVQRSTAQGNFGDGFNVSNGHVLSCRAAYNGGFGLEPSFTSTSYGLSSFVCNNSGGNCTNVAQVATGGVQLGANHCGTDTVCP